MALKANFSNNNIGIPLPDCYIKVESALVDTMDKVVRAWVVFYVNQSQRDNDLRDKRKQVEVQLEAKKSDLVKEQQKKDPDLTKLEAVSQELQTIQKQLETVTGDRPIYSKVFEFTITGQEKKNILDLVYEKLKATTFSGLDDGKLIELDFTKALDV